MVRICRVVTVAAMLGAFIAHGFAQTSPALSSLTVPESALPSHCRLQPYVSPTAPVWRDGTTTVAANRWTTGRFPSNPWLGTDRDLVIELRRHIDLTQSRPLPDALPPSASDRAALDARWAEEIVEGYRAEYYVSDDGTIIEVAAVRFNTEKQTADATSSIRSLLQMPRGATYLRVIGTVAVRVAASSTNDCFRTVDQHIRAWK